MTTKTIIEALATIADPTGKLGRHLDSTSYYTDPASVHRHRCYPGGLSDHCLGVFLFLRRICGAYSASSPCAQAWPDSTLAIVALAHDLTKVGTYQRTMKPQRVKNPDGSFAVRWDGKPVWEDVQGYEYIPHPFPLGHGDLSMYRLLDILPDLRTQPGHEEILLAVRWHMGPWNAAVGEEQLRLGDANTKTPLVLLTQFADQLDTFHGLPSEMLIVQAMNDLADLFKEDLP